MTKIDLRSQVQGVLPRLYGGTDNEVGAATSWVIVPVFNDSGATIASGSVVTKTAATRTLHRCSVAGQPIIGVVVGYYPADGGALILGGAPTGFIAAVVVSGLVTVLTTATADIGQYLSASTTAGQATPSTTKPLGAFGYCIVAISSSICHALIGNIESTGATPYGTPAVVLGTAAAAGSATTIVRTDATIVAFDGTSPTTIVHGDTADTGAVAKAARRDHTHGMAALSSTTPAAEPFGASGVIGTSPNAAHGDHVHAMPAEPGTIMISDTPSTPLVFADLVQNEAQDDLVYGD